ncbi:AMP-binding protein, partial [Paenactinomyces guangxiensis]|uniref:non-ribosomal peptide synthetase n=1 Tax=Paenactinomyces guangxiensis TaxID=1490290 RepID=UPI0036081D7A
IRRDLSRNPLFDTIFVLQNLEMPKLEIPGLTFKPYELEWKKAKFDLTWTAVEGETLSFAVEYSTSLFKRDTIERMAEHFIHILEQIVHHPEICLSEIELVTETEKQQLLVEFNDTEADYPREKTLHELFEEQVRKTPDHMVVVFGEERLTYRELNERANQLARALREKGIRRNEFVGLLVERSVEMIVGILGILKAGGAYVPIDPAYPSDRIRYMLEDSGARWLLVQQQVKVPSGYTGEILAIDNRELYRGEGPDVETVNTPHDLIYMIYTSGSTGKPKGVMVEHRNVVRLLFNDQSRFDFGEHDVWGMFHSFCFDVSVWEMFGALLNGGKLVVIPAMTARDPGQMLNLLRREQVTVLCQTPSAFYPLSH